MIGFMDEEKGKHSEKVKKIRRRIEEKLRKNCSEREVIDIAELLNVNTEVDDTFLFNLK